MYYFFSFRFSELVLFVFFLILFIFCFLLPQHPCETCDDRAIRELKKEKSISKHNNNEKKNAVYRSTVAKSTSDLLSRQKKNLARV